MTKKYKITKIGVSEDENVAITFLCVSDDTDPITSTIEIDRNSSVEDVLELISNESDIRITSQIERKEKKEKKEMERSYRTAKANELKLSLNSYIDKEMLIEEKEKEKK